MPLRPRTLEKILVAIERLVDRGVEPSIELVRKQIRRDDPRDRSSSRETIAPILRQWSEERLARASSRIFDAVEAVAALRSRAERDEVSRLLAERTDGAVRVKFTVRRGATGLSVREPSGETVPAVARTADDLISTHQGRSSS